MNTILRKIVHLIQSDQKIKLKIGAFIVLAVLLAIVGNVSKKQAKELARLVKEQKLVMQIPEMEKKIKYKDLKYLEPEKQLDVIKSVLEGTSYRDNMYHAVIDGAVYSTDDMIGDYTITKITMESIVLQNKDRNETKILNFPEYDQND